MTQQTLTNAVKNGLNLRAYLTLPPHDVSIEEEVRGVILAARRRTCSPQEAEQAILRILGRELDALESAVREALCERK
jgi:hypothetical protein